MRQASPGRINPALTNVVKIIEHVQPISAPLKRDGALAIQEPRLRRASANLVVKHAPHAVIIIENMTVPPDRRVWQQARALRDDGWRVSIISPQMGAYTKARETIEGIEIYRHPLLMEARNIAGYAIEYAGALLAEMFMLLRLDLKDIDVVQICNPPDFLFAPALLAKKIGGAKVVFDHHDLTPELLAEKTGSEHGPLLRFARWAERKTFQTADRVISTNASFRDIAIEKGGKNPDDVTVVYSSPDLTRLNPGEVRAPLKKGKDHLLFWVGMIGSQDGLDLLLEAAAHLKGLPGGDNYHLLIAGDGPERAAMEAHAQGLGLQDEVTFAGFLSGDDLANAFATADIGVGSDPKNAFNDRLAMNKIMEYMAYGLPSVLFDLTECRKIAGLSAFYAANNDPTSLAACLSNLIESPVTRATMGAKGFARLSDAYSWQNQKEKYIDVYRSLIESA